MSSFQELDKHIFGEWLLQLNDGNSRCHKCRGIIPPYELYYRFSRELDGRDVNGQDYCSICFDGLKAAIAK